MGGLFLRYTMLTPLLVNWLGNMLTPFLVNLLGNDNWDSLVNAFYRAKLANSQLPRRSIESHSLTVGNGSSKTSKAVSSSNADSEADDPQKI